MDNVQAAISTPQAVPAKAAVPDAPQDNNGEPLHSTFLAVLTQQVKSLKGAPRTGVPGAEDAKLDAADADPAQGVADAKSPAELAAIALPLLAALPPALVPAQAAASAAVSASASPVAAAVVAAIGPAAVTATAPPVTAKLPPARGDIQSATDGDSAASQDIARKGANGKTTEAAALPAPAAAPANATADLVARGELLRVAERAQQHGADGRENNAQAVPQLQFTQALATERAAAPAATAVQLQLDTALGANGWSSELGQKVVWMVGEKQQVAELRVNPPDLGPLDIKLTIDGQQTTAVFTSPHASVREAVESALPRLKEVLAESGIMLGNASVTADSPRDGSAFAPPPRSRQAAGTDSAQAAARLQPAGDGVVRGHGIVDLFA